MPTIDVTGDPLSITQVVAVAKNLAVPRMAESVPARMAPARQFVESVVTEGRVVYGVTTGFGALPAAVGAAPLAF